MKMIGDVGGVTESVLLLFGFMIYPISNFSFNIVAMKRWFLVRTSDKGVVEKEDAAMVYNDEFTMTREQKKEIKKHKKIILKPMD